MRKIKKKILSKEYKKWETKMEKSGAAHDLYNSSKNDYYWDVVMNLFNCQEGLCAYTEIQLCSQIYYISTNWNSKGEWINPDHPSNPEVNGQLEHFNPNLKKNKAWLWDNFFMADTNINTKIKKKKEVDDILKPDRKGYDEFDLLSYNRATHLFIANPKHLPAIQARINKMIITLGINFRPIKDQRKMYLNLIIKTINAKLDTWDNVTIKQFPTAFEMIKREINL